MTLAERFEAKVDRATGQGPRGDCRRWTGTRRGDYGSIRADGRMRGAHVVALFLEHGLWPPADKPCVLHSCDQRWCVNAEHLRHGTRIENVRDMHQRGRNYNPRGAAHGRAKLSEQQAREVLDLARDGALPQRTIAHMYGVSSGLIHQIKTGMKWGHLA